MRTLYSALNAQQPQPKQLITFVLEIAFNKSKNTDLINQQYQQDMQEWNESQQDWIQFSKELQLEDSVIEDAPDKALYLECSAVVTNGPGMLADKSIKYPFPLKDFTLMSSDLETIARPLIQDTKEDILTTEQNMLHDLQRELMDLGFHGKYAVQVFVKFDGKLVGDEVVLQNTQQPDQMNGEQAEAGPAYGEEPTTQQVNPNLSVNPVAAPSGPNEII